MIFIDKEHLINIYKKSFLTRKKETKEKININSIKNTDKCLTCNQGLCKFEVERLTAIKRWSHIANCALLNLDTKPN